MPETVVHYKIKGQHKTAKAENFHTYEKVSEMMKEVNIKPDDGRFLITYNEKENNDD